MADKSAIREKLEAIARERGLQEPNIVKKLGPALSDLWDLTGDPEEVRGAAIGRFRELISALPEDEKYKDLARVCLNIDLPSEAAQLHLTNRREWLGSPTRKHQDTIPSFASGTHKYHYDKIYGPIEEAIASEWQIRFPGREFPTKELEKIQHPARRATASAITPSLPAASFSPSTEPLPDVDKRSTQPYSRPKHRRLQALRAMAGASSVLALLLCLASSGTPAAPKEAGAQSTSSSTYTEYGAWPGTQCAVLYQCGSLPSGVAVNAGIANLTEGNSLYQASVVASYDQVLKLQILYENLDTTAPDVGITLRLLLPSPSGHTWKIGAGLSDGSRSTDVTTTVELNRSDAKLVLVQDSVTWRHNTAAVGASDKFATEHIPDASVLDPSQPLETLHAGPHYVASVAVLFRVVVPGVAIDVYAKSPTVHTWLTDVYVKLPATLELAIEIKNDGNVPLYGVRAEDIIPRGATYVPGSTIEAADTTGPGTPQPDALLTSTGVQIGTLAPGQSAIVRFSLHIDGGSSASLLPDIGIVLASGMNYYWNDVYIRPEIAN